MEEKFLRFCSGLEERSISMLSPEEMDNHLKNMQYSRLNDGEFHKCISDPEKFVPAPDEDQDLFTEEQMEKARIAETASLVRDHEHQAPVIRSIEDSENPLGDLEQAQLYLFSDLHHAMERTSLVREEGFSGYAPFRFGSRLGNARKQQKQFPEILEPEAVKPANLARATLREIREGKRGAANTDELITLHYVMQENVRNLFHEWTAKVVAGAHSGNEAVIPDADVPVFFSLGDGVHDTGTLLDQMDVERKSYGLLSQVEQLTGGLKPDFLSLWGNHDQDPRTPDSFVRTTQLFGHRVFSQKIDGVLMAAVDTNIVNPEWEAQFMKRATDEAKELLAVRKQIQEAVLNRVRDFGGPVILIGHNPARLIDEYSELIKTSGVTTIIGGHTHSEAHISLPFKNGRGGTVTLHVVESVVREKKGDPQAPKLYAMRVGEGKAQGMWTLQEPEKRFARRYKRLMSDLRKDTPNPGKR